MRPPAPDRTPFNWAEWLIYSALALWVLVLVPSVVWGWDAIKGVLQHEYTPAWFQAVGSVVAIFVAVWVPWRQREHGLRDARVHALSVAAYVVATVRLARREHVFINPDAAEVAIGHLQVAARLWPGIRLDSLPAPTIPPFVALIALTDEAMALARFEASDSARITHASVLWDDISKRAYGHIQKIFDGRPVVLPDLASRES